MGLELLDVSLKKGVRSQFRELLRQVPNKICIAQLKGGKEIGSRSQHRPLHTWTGHSNLANCIVALKVKRYISGTRSGTMLRSSLLDSPIHQNLGHTCVEAIPCNRPP